MNTLEDSLQTMMIQTVNIRTEDDIYFALSAVRHIMKNLHFTEMDQQKVLVSVSELSRNILDHAYGKGTFICEVMGDSLCMTVKDEGPGIRNLDEVLKGNQPSSSHGLGLGLSGVKRLMDELFIETNGEGTKIVAVKWTGKRNQLGRNG